MGPYLCPVAVVTIDDIDALGRPIELEVPVDGSSVTPASRVCVEAIARHGKLLAGKGIDWGSGSGCLAIAAARLDAVDRVVGVEVPADAAVVANRNATRNGVDDKVTVFHGDSYKPFARREREVLQQLVGATDFLIANPPTSQGDDGLGRHRRVLAGAFDYLVAGAPVFLQVSHQYGRRIPLLASEVPGYAYGGILATSDWVAFDQQRPALAAALEQYAAEEARGAMPYDFRRQGRIEAGPLSATAALVLRDRDGASPLSRWQAHLYRRLPRS